jgi:radical SAM protein with 4Fe4S-binding SPASM domain
MMLSENKFIKLTPHSVLKNLEAPFLYDIQNDELYELSTEAYQFLLQTCLGETPPIRREDEDFVQFCLAENLITFSGHPSQRTIFSDPSPIPSLRYLELQITDRCNLKCHHCYLGEGSHQDLSFEQIQRILKEFEEIQGLRLLLSGGEPLLHPRIWEVNDLLRGYEFRSVLLSNGTLITEEVAKKLHVHEVQVSLDGMKEGHESLRGKGTFEKTLLSIDHLQEANIRVSVATMIHQRNLSEFDQLASLIQSKHIEEWNVDIPCVEGRLKENQDLWVSPQQAGPFLSYGFGGGFHGSTNNATCGAHLCAILPNGAVCKCGLFSQEPVGSIEEGLRTCWVRIPRIPLKDLTCNCSVIEECKGGCRYRAKIQRNLFQPDLYQCYARGVLKGGEKNEYQEGS